MVAAVPITEATANDPKFSATFKKKRKKRTDVVPKRQAEVEEEWDNFTKANYKKAETLAQKALSMM